MPPDLGASLMRSPTISCASFLEALLWMVRVAFIVFGKELSAYSWQQCGAYGSVVFALQSTGRLHTLHL